MSERRRYYKHFTLCPLLTSYRICCTTQVIRLYSEPIMQVTVTHLKQQGAAELIAAGVSYL